MFESFEVCPVWDHPALWDLLGEMEQAAERKQEIPSNN
jgi:hypothetical protein